MMITKGANNMSTITPKNKPIISSKIDGNIFAIVGTASRALKNAGFETEAKQMKEKVFGAKDYNEALRIITGYVKFK